MRKFIKIIKKLFIKILNLFRINTRKPDMRNVYVSIEDVEILDVQYANIEIETPVNERGNYTGRTHSAKITIERIANTTPSVKLFEKITNEDGRRVFITGKLEYYDPTRQTIITYVINEGYIAEWGIHQNRRDDALREKFVIRAGKMEINAGGGSKSLEVPEFNKSAT